MRRLAASVIAAALVVTACSGRGGSERGSDETDVLRIFGPYRGAEADLFAASLARFELRTGIEVRYTGSANFVSDLRARVLDGVSVPDVAIVPQPGVIDGLIGSDRLVPLDDTTLAAVEENYGADGGELVDGRFAAPYRSTIKSLVWYRPDVFDEHGWTVPTTLDQLTDLVEEIQAAPAAGLAPWCFTMFAGSATGWAATDWVEDLLLREAGPEVYDEWISGERDFSDPEIVDAFETFRDLVLLNGRVAGGLAAIVETDVTEASGPLFGEDPGCAMYKQATFAADWFPDDVTVGDDVDFFVMPGDGGTPPLVTGGDHLVQFSDDERVDQLMQFLVSPDGSREWARRGGYLSDRISVDGDYYDEIDQRFAGVLLEDRVERFDASDSMPPEIGAALFWTEITNWIRGATTLDEFLATMDEARDPS